MFYRNDTGGRPDPDLGTPPLTVVLRHARDGESEETTQVDFSHRAVLELPNLGEFEVSLEIRRSPPFWRVRIIAFERGRGREGRSVLRDVHVSPMIEEERALPYHRRTGVSGHLSLEEYLVAALATQDEFDQDEYHGSPV